MALLLNPRVWGAILVAALLAASHFGAYRQGKAVVTAQLIQERLELAQATLEAAQKSALELQEATRKVQDVQTKLAAEKKRAAADALAATDELRLLEAALDSARKDYSVAPSGDHGAIASELLGSCARRYTGMASEADTAVNRLTALQSYVLAVCK